jgi:hypothetical protein
MTSEPAGAYFATANIGFATSISARLLAESIFLALTGLHPARSSHARREHAGLRENAACHQLIA